MNDSNSKAIAGKELNVFLAQKVLKSKNYLRYGVWRRKTFEMLFLKLREMQGPKKTKIVRFVKTLLTPKI